MTSTDNLITLINSVNPNEPPFTSDQLVFSDPIVEDGTNWNTRVSVTPVTNSVYTDSVDVTYSRIDLSVLGNDVALSSGKEFDFKTILDNLNTAQNTFLDADDIEQVYIPQLGLGGIEAVTLTAKPTSLGWTGNVTVTIMFGLPSNVSSLHTLMNTTLASNNYLTNGVNDE